MLAGLRHRSAVDRVIAGLRRSEAAALEWRDVTDARDEDGLLVAVRRSKTNPDGETADVRRPRVMASDHHSDSRSSSTARSRDAR